MGFIWNLKNIENMESHRKLEGFSKPRLYRPFNGNLWSETSHKWNFRFKKSAPSIHFWSQSFWQSYCHNNIVTIFKNWNLVDNILLWNSKQIQKCVHVLFKSRTEKQPLSNTKQDTFCHLSFFVAIYFEMHTLKAHPFALPMTFVGSRMLKTFVSKVWI